MKKFLWILPMLMSVLFVACKDNEDNMTFTFDENGNCFTSSGQQITQQEYQTLVIGNAWKCESECPITENGTLKGTNLLDGSWYGTSPTTYYFKKDSIFRYFVDMSVLVNVRSTDANIFNATSATVSSKHIKLHIISVDKYNMIAIDASGGEYCYCKFRRLNAEQLGFYLKNYTADYDSIRAAQRNQN
jgi:hypothetical protein